MQAWYVVNTLSNQESRAEENLARQGYRVWLPFYSRTTRHARRTRTVRSPIFPGYLFISLDLETEIWSPINSTFGVRRLLCQGRFPAQIPCSFVDGLKSSLDNGETELSQPSELSYGQNLQIIGGPFMDSIGTFLTMTAKDRVMILLDLLGREVRTTVPRHAVTPVS